MVIKPSKLTLQAKPRCKSMIGIKSMKPGEMTKRIKVLAASTEAPSCVVYISLL